MNCKYCNGELKDTAEMERGICNYCIMFHSDDEHPSKNYHQKDPWDDQAPYSEYYDDQYCF
jgi:hypothetical protein